MRFEPEFTGPELCHLTACDVVDMLKKQEISAAELVTASATRISQTRPAINAMVTTCADRAHAAAANADPASPLAGLPIGIKDLTPVAGVRTTYGTPALADNVPQTSDAFVLRIEARGGIVMGKTNTPEMGNGGNTFNPVFGATRNPWDTRMNAGGSSGGAAAGLAAGDVWLSQGSDLAGSLRTPASFCGIVGLRPSPGVAGGSAGEDVFGLLGVEGPMARTVEDCALMLDVMCGWDPASPISFPAPEHRYLDTCRAEAGHIRIAYSPDLNGLAPVDPDMAANLATAMARLQAPDVDVTEETPSVSDVSSCFRTLRALNMWTGSRTIPKHVSDHFKATLKENTAAGGALNVDQIADANIARSRLYKTMQHFLGRFDVLACPVTGIGPLPVEIEYPMVVAGVESRDYLDWLSFSYLATACGLPALSLPLGRDAQGMPFGVQLIGPPRGEGRLLQVARRLEQATGCGGTPIDPRTGQTV
jgi:amidase